MRINDYWHPDAFPRARTDIAFNIEYGAKYLKGQFSRYGSPVRARPGHRPRARFQAKAKAA